jgi:hypothetical protein
MGKKRKRNAMLAIAAAIALAGAIVAVVTSGKGHTPPVQAARRALHNSGRSEVELVAHYLGLTPARLRAQAQGGRSLAQIAAATPGRSANGLIRTLVRAKTRRLRAAYASGRLSRQQLTTRLARLRRRVTRRVRRTARAPVKQS